MQRQKTKPEIRDVKEEVRSECCGNCRFFDRKQADLGFCCAGHPTVLFLGFIPPKVAGGAPTPMMPSVFPETTASRFCGDYQVGQYPSRAKPVMPIIGKQIDLADDQLVLKGSA